MNSLLPGPKSRSRSDVQRKYFTSRECYNKFKSERFAVARTISRGLAHKFPANYAQLFDYNNSLRTEVLVEPLSHRLNVGFPAGRVLDRRLNLPTELQLSDGIVFLLAFRILDVSGFNYCK